MGTSVPVLEARSCAPHEPRALLLTIGVLLLRGSSGSEPRPGELEDRRLGPDTTIFSRVGLLLSLADLQGFSVISRCLVASALSRTLRSFAV